MRGKNIKYKIDEIQQEFIKRGYIPLFDKYNNNLDRLLAKTKEGYKVLVCLGVIRKGQCPSIFSKSNPYTIENIKLWLKLNNSPYKLISTEFISACNDKLLLSCPVHGEFEISWNAISQGIGCRICSGNIKLTVEEIKSRLLIINSDIEILSGNYINQKSKFKCRCKIDGNIWNATGTNLINNECGCPVCALKNKSGKNNYRWKGGITPLHEYLRHTITQWKNDSFKKYNYTCDITGQIGGKLIIHHWYNFSDILLETMKVLSLPIYPEVNRYSKNELKLIEDLFVKMHYKYGLGVCLCEEEHKRFHKIYGIHNNTLNQYEEFKINRLKELNIIINEAS